MVEKFSTFFHKNLRRCINIYRMELTLSELKKRDVINIADGKCLGRITDIKFCFPEGVIEGIIVPGRKSCRIFGAFSRSSLYIPDKNIVKIGGDVILVNLACGMVCDQFVSVDSKRGEKSCKSSASNDSRSSKNNQYPPPCPPKCPPPCPPQCPPPCPPQEGFEQGFSFSHESEINFDDY